ncbi:MAG: DUF4290 domain-containing protein [Bacteroidota bacterium]|nr:DUF4290 domain-containing protein [Bacteroidota bacterium]
MEYNTTRPDLIISEYGRNIQKMAEYIVQVEDRERRTRMAHALVNIMAMMHPDTRDTVDLKHKLWDHLYIMCDFKLDVDAAFPPPSQQDLYTKPDRIGYPQEEIELRPYGKLIHKIIKEVSKMDDSPEREVLIKNIANHLKKSYLNWNRDSVNDELIAEHLELLSNGKLKLSEDMHLSHTNEILGRNRPSNNRSKKLQSGRQQNNPNNPNSSNSASSNANNRQQGSGSNSQGGRKDFRGRKRP